ncbi:MAG: TonB-dependent receptor [Bacteroidales bacterium]|nr:TonB-dependent receptor [Bacteroidales bacterium]
MKKIAIIIFSFLPLLATAQNHHDTVRLRQMVITSTLHATLRSNAPTTVGVIDGSQMDAVSAVNLGEGLCFSTGLRVENTCQNCGSNEVRINGLSQAYSQILIDSRPINSALAGVYLLDQLPASMIDRVEVLRGGGSALYGSNAIAGVINVITREPHRNEASIGNTTHLIGGKSIDWSNSFNASVVSGDRRAGLSLFGHNRHRDPYDHNGDGYSEIGLLKARMVGFRGYLRTSDFSKLNLEYHNIHDFRRGGDRFDLPSPMAHISEGGEHDINSVSLKWDWLPASGMHHASLFASLQHVDRQSYYGERDDSEPFGTAYGYTDNLTLNYGAIYSRHFDTLLFMPAEFTVGLEHTLDRLHDHTIDNPDTMRQHVAIVSAYLQNEWKSDRWSILAGARIDKHTMVNAPVLSPRLNLRFAPNDHLSLRAGYASGFRAPQIYDEDLHVGAVNGQLYKITNAPDLTMERSHSLNASADICLHIGSLEADLLVECFYTRINDAFVNELLFDDTVSGYLHYERRNADGATVKGVNVEMTVSPIEPMRIQLGGTWQSSRYTGQGKEWEENMFERRMERTPDIYAYLSGVYTPIENLQLTATGTFTGPMLVYHSVADDSKHSLGSEVHKVITPSFLDLSLKAAYTIPFGDHTALELSVGVQNIFNSYQRDLDSGPERDAAYIYGPALPRTLFACAKLKI